MKINIILMTFLYSLSVAAQTKTVGPALPPTGESYDVPVSVNISAAANFVSLEKILLKRELACGSRKDDKKYENLMDSYLRLSLKNVDGECSIGKKVLKCINNSQFKAAMKEINHDGVPSRNYLEASFSIDTESAKKVIHFFNNLGKDTPE